MHMIEIENVDLNGKKGSYIVQIETIDYNLYECSHICCICNAISAPFYLLSLSVYIICGLFSIIVYCANGYVTYIIRRNRFL